MFCGVGEEEKEEDEEELPFKCKIYRRGDGAGPRYKAHAARALGRLMSFEGPRGRATCVLTHHQRIYCSISISGWANGATFQTNTPLEGRFQPSESPVEAKFKSGESPRWSPVKVQLKSCRIMCFRGCPA